jgi:hypothetical protein
MTANFTTSYRDGFKPRSGGEDAAAYLGLGCEAKQAAVAWI